MGQYLQAGICYRISISKRELSDVITNEQLFEALNKEIELSLFDVEESDEYIRFHIKDTIVLEQLHDIMKHEFSLFNDEYTDIFESVLSEISQKKSLAEIVEFAKKEQSRFFHDTDVYQNFEVLSWISVRANVSLLSFFSEGKILMECYDDFLRYLEKLVRLNSKQAIAGAFRAFIQ